jgi:hypothetical protein
VSTAQTIWKFPIPVRNVVVPRIPHGAAFLHAAPSPTDPHAVDTWWEVDTRAVPVPVAIHVVGTGHPIPQNAREHLATVPMPSGLVWHLRRERSTRVIVLDNTHLSAVRSAPWYAGQKIIDLRDLRGYTLGPGDIIVGDIARRDPVNVALMSQRLPDGVTADDLVGEVETRG